jgi:hypothetical protein
VTTLKQLERDIINDVRLEWGRRADVRLFRNNVGVLPRPEGGMLTYGLCIGSSDLIGLKSIIVTPEMVGERVALFVALEGKVHGSYPSPEQRAFIAMVKVLGGRAGVFRNDDDVHEILEGLK